MTDIRQWKRVSIVLCQLLITILCADVSAQSDTTITFERESNAVEFPREAQRKRGLDGIVTLGVGPYTGFNKGEYTTFIQPSVGFEFLARPAGFVNILLGGHIGLSDPLTVAVLLGSRFHLNEDYNDGTSLFIDGSLVFFDEAERIMPIGLGGRIAVGGRVQTFTKLEARLAGEYRGRGSATIDGSNARSLWWIGAELGLAFSLTSEEIVNLTFKDSVRAAMYPITKAADMAELELLNSRQDIQEWLEKFWAKRDVTSSTVRNEAREEYERRVNFANEHFSRRGRLGVTTDMGRVVVIYGRPDVSEEATSYYDASYRYVLWVYQGRIANVPRGLFLFEIFEPRDPYIIYSNVPGEQQGVLPKYLPQKMAKWF